jgi:hypothetical protein
MKAEATGLDVFHPFSKEAETRRIWAEEGLISLVEPGCDFDVEERIRLPVRRAPHARLTST